MFNTLISRIVDKAKRAFVLPHHLLGVPVIIPSTPQTNLIGYKKMDLSIQKHGIQFSSPTYNSLVGVKAEAECLNDEADRFNTAHAVPVSYCSCGWYAYKKPHDAFGYDHHENIVVEVAMSGRFIEYRGGYRAQYQRVKKIMVGDCNIHNKPGIALRSSYSKLVPACSTCIGQNPKRKLVMFNELPKMLDSTSLESSYSLPKVEPANPNVTPMTWEQYKKRPFKQKLRDFGNRIVDFMEYVLDYLPFITLGIFLPGWAWLVFLTVTQPR